MSRSFLCLIATAAAAAMTIACGAVRAPAPAAQRVILHQADAGRTVAVHRGDTVELVLSEPRPVPGVSLTWTATSSAPSVLDPTSTDPHGPSSGSYFMADFAARAAGSSELTAQGTQRCEAMLPQACQQPRLTFRVVVQ
ncbi:MAG TPA: hypothetical protein VGO86_09325 [Candidatus Dormibacteraeota bacterium]|jgi:hypothetical protein